MATVTLEDRAPALLADLAGPDATFRPHQFEAIRDLVEDRARVLCVQRTGWGKSAVYFIATALLRERGAGPALIVSPLLALMRNQIAAAERLGIRAHTINSTNRDAWEEVQRLLAEDAVDLLLISPERLNNPQFRDTMLPLFVERVGLLVVDEAHCISDWGHDFRPDYRRLAEVLERLPAGVAVLCTTATANDRVVADVAQQLQLGHAGELKTYRGPLGRSSLRLEVVDLPGRADRLAWLATWLPKLEGSGIVYTLTKRDAELVAEWLTAHGVAAEAYSGEVDSEKRVATEERLLANDLKAVVATSALGMGYDKPDLGFVVHYQAPGSVISYYQQVGRAGRRTSGSRTSSSSRPSPRARSSSGCWRRSTPRTGRRSPRSSPTSTSGAGGSRRCSRCSTSRVRWSAAAPRGDGEATPIGPTRPSATPRSPR
jgi:ATP-dependent DNA helicase RecQ